MATPQQPLGNEMAVALPAGLRRVALVFGTFPPSNDGGADFVYNLSKHLAQAGLEVHVITSKEWAGFDATGMPDGFRLWPIVGDWRLRATGGGGAQGFVDALSKIQPHVVHVVYPCSRHVNDYELPVLLKRSVACPVVVTFFSLDLLKGVTWRTRLNSLRLITSSDVVTTHDPFYLRILKALRPHRGFGAYLVPVGVNVDPGHQTYDPLLVPQMREVLGLEEANYVAHFGQVDASRDVATLMRAAAMLRGSRRNVKVLMIGADQPDWNKATGADRRAQRAATESAAALGEKAVMWTGYVSQEQVVRYFLASDCAVLPFRRNTLGRSSLALALTLGMPVVTSGKRQNAFMRDRVNALLVPPGNARALASAMALLLDSPALRAHLSSGARQVSRWYSWQSVTSRTLLAYAQATRMAGGSLGH